jgi:hypothetical protein
MENPTTRQGNRPQGESAALFWTEPATRAHEQITFRFKISEINRRRGNYPPVLDSQEGYAVVNCGCEKWVRRQHESGPITQTVFIKGCAFRLPREHRTSGELLLYKLRTTSIFQNLTPEWYRGPITYARVYRDLRYFLNYYTRETRWLPANGYERVVPNI